MKVLVCGGRNYRAEISMCIMLNWLHAACNFSQLIHGGAAGADRMAGEWARRHDVPVRIFCADWKRFGLKAGPLRNQEMLDCGKSELVVAFPGGRGTADMVARAERAGISVVSP